MSRCAAVIDLRSLYRRSTWAAGRSSGSRSTRDTPAVPRTARSIATLEAMHEKPATGCAALRHSRARESVLSRPRTGCPCCLVLPTRRLSHRQVTARHDNFHTGPATLPRRSSKWELGRGTRFACLPAPVALTASEAKVSAGSIDPGRYLTLAATHQELGCSTCTQQNLNRRRSFSVRCSKP